MQGKLGDATRGFSICFDQLKAAIGRQCLDEFLCFRQCGIFFYQLCARFVRKFWVGLGNLII